MPLALFRRCQTGGGEALHFWYDAAILPAAMAWVFPRGETATIGLGSYRGVRPMRAAMERFARSLGVTGYGLRGAHFPCALAHPTAGHVFVVGDAAGQCIALTGEGVRPALYFGEACGRVLERLLAGASDLQAALAQYAAIVAGKERFYRFFTRMQWVLTRVPVPLVEWLSVYTAGDGQRPRVLERYWSLTREWGPPG